MTTFVSTQWLEDQLTDLAYEDSYAAARKALDAVAYVSVRAGAYDAPETKQITWKEYEDVYFYCENPSAVANDYIVVVMH